MWYFCNFLLLKIDRIWNFHIPAPPPDPPPGMDFLELEPEAGFLLNIQVNIAISNQQFIRMSSGRRHKHFLVVLLEEYTKQ